MRKKLGETHEATYPWKSSRFFDKNSPQFWMITIPYLTTIIFGESIFFSGLHQFTSSLINSCFESLLIISFSCFFFSLIFTECLVLQLTISFTKFLFFGLLGRRFGFPPRWLGHWGKVEVLLHGFEQTKKSHQEIGDSMPASLKGCQMVPRGCQFTIP